MVKKTCGKNNFIPLIRPRTDYNLIISLDICRTQLNIPSKFEKKHENKLLLLSGINRSANWN